MARVAPPLTVEAPFESETDPLSSTFAALELSAKERKAFLVTMPWKVRLRILRLLLKLHVEQQKLEEEGMENCGGGASSPIEKFVDTFLPEVSLTQLQRSVINEELTEAICLIYRYLDV